MKFLNFTANYWSRDSKVKNNTAKNGDCAIRALCVATGYGYKKICELLGVGDEFLPGLGYGYAPAQGISIEQLDDFASRTGIIESIYKDEMFDVWMNGGQDKFDLQDLTGEDMLKEFVDSYLPIIMDEEKCGDCTKFVAVVRSNKAKSAKDNLGLHVTALGKRGNTWLMVDSPSNKTAAFAIPVAIYAVKKECDKDSPDHYNNEGPRLKSEMNDYLRKLGKKKKAG